ncbi:MAG: 30S ribosomal protein S12 methylthiotransferase RimO [Ignavibacteria bacterium]|nr:30S ribosomal protein S12 methylthiotransferase RimO [Ignavibacteria bacterium]
MSGPRVQVVTLGCPKNQVDSEVLLAQLKLGDASIVPEGEAADVTVVNTCGFIEAAKRESVDAILFAVRDKEAGRVKQVFVMGCLSERYATDLSREIPEVDAFFGSHEIESVVKRTGVDVRRELLGERYLTTPLHFAYIKISEGCDRPCSFCAIPLMRESHVSKPLEMIVSEARRLAEKGVRELMVIGQDTTYYGLDTYGSRRLREVLELLSSDERLRWIRLMYAYPAGFPLEILPVMRERKNLCKYLDIPLQHISDPVLRSMRRGTTGSDIRRLVQQIQDEVPGIALRTTLIVGYPNETEKDFQQLYDFVEETRFHRLGVFTYSREDGTAADELGDPIPEEVKLERQAAIMQLQTDISEERNRQLLGTEITVLIDRRDGETFVGRTEWDAPEIDQEVYVESDVPLKSGSFYTVQITRSEDHDLFGVPVTTSVAVTL